MSLRTFMRTVTTTRRVIRALDRIAVAQEAQTILLQQIADVVAPKPPALHPGDLAQTSATFSQDHEQVRIQQFVEQVWRDLKREPTEEEIVDFLDGRMLSLK